MHLNNGDIYYRYKSLIAKTIEAPHSLIDAMTVVCNDAFPEENLSVSETMSLYRRKFESWEKLFFASYDDFGGVLTKIDPDDDWDHDDLCEHYDCECTDDYECYGCSTGSYDCECSSRHNRSSSKASDVLSEIFKTCYNDALLRRDSSMTA